jgi:hypothetical protein
MQDRLKIFRDTFSGSVTLDTESDVERVDTYITVPKMTSYANDAVKIGVRVTYTDGSRWGNIVQCSLTQLEEAIAEMKERECTEVKCQCNV